MFYYRHTAAVPCVGRMSPGGFRCWSGCRPVVFGAGPDVAPAIASTGRVPQAGAGPHRSRLVMAGRVPQASAGVSHVSQVTAGGWPARLPPSSPKF